LDNPLLELRVELQERLVGTACRAGGCHAAAAAAGRYNQERVVAQGLALPQTSSSLGVVLVRQPQEERVCCCCVVVVHFQRSRVRRVVECAASRRC
jgi:hypothetical protein